LVCFLQYCDVFRYEDSHAVMESVGAALQVSHMPFRVDGGIVAVDLEVFSSGEGASAEAYAAVQGFVEFFPR